MLLFRKERRILITISFLSLSWGKFEWLKNDIQYKNEHHKIHIQLQIRLEISLFKLVCFKFIALLKILLLCAILTKLQLHKNVSSI